MPGVGKRLAQRCRIVRRNAVELGIPTGFLVAAEIGDVQKFRTAIGINGDEADPEVFVHGLKGLARCRLHHQHTGAVIAVPVGEIGSLVRIARPRRRTHRFFREQCINRIRSVDFRRGTNRTDALLVKNATRVVVVLLLCACLRAAIDVVVRSLTGITVVVNVAIGLKLRPQIDRRARPGAEAVFPGIAKAGSGVADSRRIDRWRVGDGGVVIDTVALAAGNAVLAGKISSIIGHVGPVHTAGVIEHEHHVRFDLGGRRCRRKDRRWRHIGHARHSAGATSQNKGCSEDRRPQASG